jgi:hypothetical protein
MTAVKGSGGRRKAAPGLLTCATAARGGKVSVDAARPIERGAAAAPSIAGAVNQVI